MRLYRYRQGSDEAIDWVYSEMTASSGWISADRFAIAPEGLCSIWVSVDHSNLVYSYRGVL
jgi:hypothetical protein